MCCGVVAARARVCHVCDVLSMLCGLSLRPAVCKGALYEVHQAGGSMMGRGGRCYQKLECLILFSCCRSTNFTLAVEDVLDYRWNSAPI